MISGFRCNRLGGSVKLTEEDLGGREVAGQPPSVPDRVEVTLRVLRGVLGRLDLDGEGRDGRVRLARKLRRHDRRRRCFDFVCHLCWLFCDWSGGKPS